jgi:hypothetical protein
MKNAVFRDMTPCGFCENRRFEATYRLHHRVERSQRARRNGSSNCLVADIFHTDDGGDTFLRNVSCYKSHMASHPR